MNAADAWREVLTRKISLVPALGLWVASVDEKGSNVASKKRNVRMVSAIAPSPIVAIRELVAKLDAEPMPMAVTFEDITW